MKPLSHFLISIQTMDGQFGLHSYVMTRDGPSGANVVAEYLLKEMEEKGFSPFPIVLCTNLSGKDCENDRGFVRKFFAHNSLESRKLMMEAKDFHYSAAILEYKDPANARFMEMH
jgi:hypothetical protein